MSLEICVICDRCGQIMAGVSIKAPRAGTRVRKEARESALKARTAVPGGHDYCGDCWSDIKAESKFPALLAATQPTEGNDQ